MDESKVIGEEKKITARKIEQDLKDGIDVSRYA